MNRHLLSALFCLVSLAFLASCGRKCNECEDPCDPCDNEWVEEKIVKH